MHRPQTLSLVADLAWRPLFEAARPVVPPPRVHKFIDQDTGSDTTGTGTWANPYRNPYPKTLQAQPGEYWHIKGCGTPDNASVMPLADGTAHDWITVGDWDGAPLHLPGPTGLQPVVTLDGRKHICIEHLTIDATNSSTMDGGAIRGNGQGCQHIVIRRNHVQVRPGAHGCQFFIDPSHIWIEDNDLDGHGRDDVRYANSGDGIAFGGNATAHHCYAYRNRITDFGHMGIQALTQVADRHNTAIFAGFNRVSSTLAGGIAYLRTDDSLVVGNLIDGIATNDASQSNSKEGIIVNGSRNGYYLNRIRDVHGPAILLLVNAFGGIGQSCIENAIAGNACYGGDTFPLAVTLRTATPDLHGLLTMAGNRYRGNVHARNMRNGTGGFYEGCIWQVWVTLGASGYLLSPEEFARWCPGGVANVAGRRLAGLTLTDNLFDPTGTSPTAGFLMFTASDATQANVNTTYPASADAAAQFGAAVVRGNVEADAGFSEEDPTDARWLTRRAEAEAIAVVVGG